MKLWSISPGMYQRMVNLIKSTEYYQQYENDQKIIRMLEEIDFTNMENQIKDEEMDKLFEMTIYQMGILVTKCHMASVEDYTHMVQGLNITWTLVVHENETGSFFDFEKQHGTIIDMIPNYHLTTADGCMVFYDTSNNVFQHMIVYGTQSAPNFT